MKNILFSLRMLQRNKLLTFVGIPGLAIGLAVVLLLVSYLKREYSFDKHFSTKDRVVRLYNTAVEGESGTYGICLRKAYDEIPAQIGEVESATQIYNGWTDKMTVASSKESYEDLHKLYADEGFFQVFDQKLFVGNKTDALKGKNKMVLTQSTAQKLFGTTDCVGQQIQMEGSKNPNYTVSGVVEDLPENSHLKYDLLVSMETLPLKYFGGLEFMTYFLVKNNADVQTTAKKIAQANDEIMKPWMENVGVKTVSETVLLRDAHFFTKVSYDMTPTVNMKYLWIVGGIVALVLLIAMVNFINLYSLHSGKRIGEIAMRKSLGASYNRLAGLFLSDTSIMAIIAFLLALVITYLSAPFFSTLLNSKIIFSQLFNPFGLLIITGLLLSIILLSGFYPLLSLARMNLSLGVRGKTKNVNRKNYATKIALFLQFGITAFLIAGVVILYAQVHYMKSIPLGFNPNNVEVFYANSRTISQKLSSIKDEVAHLPFVESVATSSHTLGSGYSGQVIAKYGNDEKPIPINEYRVQSGFAKTLQMKLIDGNYFSNDNAENEIILNESAVKKLGLEMPVAGKLVEYFGKRTIRGVVRDFYYAGNAGQTIQPIVLSAYQPLGGTLYVRTKAPITSEQKMQIGNIFNQFDDTYILNSFSLEQKYLAKFKEEDKMMKMVVTGALLAILLSISGLAALSLLNVNRRTKEIGVRKVMGSSERQILTLLVKQVLISILVACIIGFLVNYYVMNIALQNFVNRITISPLYFIISGSVVLFVAVLAVSWQSYRAASRNPVEALRYE